MANYDQRIPVNNAFGQLAGGVDSLGTTLNSPAFATLPTLTTTTVEDYIPLVLADDSLGLHEIVWVTAHAASSQAVTVARGREGSTARQWATGTTWRCAPTARDVIGVVATRSQLPTDAHLGARVLIADEARVVYRTSGGWLDPNERLLGRAVLPTEFDFTSTSLVNVPDLALTVQVPIARRLRLSLLSNFNYGSGADTLDANMAVLQFREGTIELERRYYQSARGIGRRRPAGHHLPGDAQRLRRGAHLRRQRAAQHRRARVHPDGPKRVPLRARVRPRGGSR